jgi:hypothetical protein
MKGFTVPAQLMTVRSMVDGGMSVGFHTSELGSEEKVHIMNFHMKAGWLLFSPNELSQSDIPKEKAVYEHEMPSQRLRSVLFVQWVQTGRRGVFEDYYRTHMEEIISSIKATLV